MEIKQGPCPGLLGDVAALHGRYYASHWDFPVDFEAKVAREMSEYLQRFDPAQDAIFRVEADDHILGSITIDGSDPALAPGQSHLRWFILAESLAGQGLGKAFMEMALKFAQSAGFKSIYLTTFEGLGPAMALYRRAGFTVVEESEGNTWGRTVLEQRLEVNF